MSTTAETETSRPGLSRRAVLGGGLGALLAFTLDITPVGPAARAFAGPACDLPEVPNVAGAVATNDAVNAWVRINPDNTVMLNFGGAEMGQGIMTGLAQGLAEELMVDWEQIRTQAAPASQGYTTGGSQGIRRNLPKMRIAGAQARIMLTTAAADRWGVAPGDCTVASGVITNGLTGETLRFADVAVEAARVTPPASPALTDPSQFRIIGTPVHRTDLPSKTNGSAIFGIDVVVPCMVYAAVKHCPTLGGTLAATPAVPAGALAVVPLDNAVAVVADNTWAAMKAASALSVQWNIPASASNLTTSKMLANQQALMETGTPGSPTAEVVGDAPGAYAAAAHQFEATYQLPFLPHVYMEVLNCTASVTATSAEVWVPTQAPTSVIKTVTAITGLPASQITVHPTLLGGGLGRKIEQDYVAQAVRVSQAIGQPVKLTWQREEDMSHDQYRPSGLIRIRLGMDEGGAVTSFASRAVTNSPMYQRGYMGATGNDNVDGTKGLPYAFGSRLVEFVLDPTPIPVGFWRSVGESMNCFAVESALDEAAALVGMDPVAFRRTLLAPGTRPRAVLDAVAAGIGWDTPPASGVARGVAVSFGFGSISALAVEVSQPVAGALTVDRAYAAVDPGIAVNPSQVVAQMQGGIIQGFSSAQWARTTFSSGKASSRNFSNSRVMKMKEVPPIEVQIIESGYANLGGMGEVGVPLAAPALANAWFALTGERIRALPMFPSAGSMGD